MSFVINLGLDEELPLMVFADVSLVYPLDHVVSRSGRRLKATEDRVHRLVQKSINDARRVLKFLRIKTQDYLQFRLLVIDTLCREYGFEYANGSTHNILREEVSDVVKDQIPNLKRLWPDE